MLLILAPPNLKTFIYFFLKNQYTIKNLKQINRKKQIEQLHYICLTFLKLKNVRWLLIEKYSPWMNLQFSKCVIFRRQQGELASLLRDIGLAAKRVNVEVNKAGLVDILGDTGNINVQGEEVKKLDDFANDHFIGVLRHGISCAGIGSEELDDIVVFDDRSK